MIGKPAFETNMPDDVGVEHLQDGVDVLFRADMFERREIQYDVVWRRIRQKTFHDGTAVIQRQGAKVDIGNAGRPAAQLADKLGKIILVVVDDVQGGRKIIEDYSHRGRADGAAAADDQNSAIAHFGQDGLTAGFEIACKK